MASIECCECLLFLLQPNRLLQSQFHFADARHFFLPLTVNSSSHMLICDCTSFKQLSLIVIFHLFHFFKLTNCFLFLFPFPQSHFNFIPDRCQKFQANSRIPLKTLWLWNNNSSSSNMPFNLDSYFPRLRRICLPPLAAASAAVMVRATTAATTQPNRFGTSTWHCTTSTAAARTS